MVAGERDQPSLPRSFVFTVDARSHLRMRCLGCSVHQMQFAVDGNLIPASFTSQPASIGMSEAGERANAVFAMSPSETNGRNY